MQWIVVLLRMMIVPLCLNTTAMGEVFFCHLYWISSFLANNHFYFIDLYETNESSIWSIMYLICWMWSSTIFHANVRFHSFLNILFIDWFYFWFWDRNAWIFSFTVKKVESFYQYPCVWIFDFSIWFGCCNSKVWLRRYAF